MNEPIRDYNWVKVCIESCLNTFQINASQNLIYLFIQKHNHYPADADDLWEIWHDTYNKIHNILN